MVIYSEFFTNQSPKIDFLKTVQKNCGCEQCSLTSRYQFGGFKTINNKTTCKFCREYKQPNFLGKEQFISDIDLKPGEKIGVTVSGGKDSIYMWGCLTDLFGADSVVAFNHKKIGLVHPMAERNMERAQRIYKTKLITVYDNEMLGRFKRNLEILLEDPTPGMVRPVLCSGCRYGITEALYEKGKKEGIIKYVSAASYLELAPFKEELLHDDCKTEKEVLREALHKNPAYDYSDNIECILRDCDYKYKGGVSSSDGNITDFHGYKLFDFDKYFENNPEIIEKTVKKRTGWMRPERSWHFDCIIEEFKDVMYYGLLGYTESDFKLAAMVRHGLLSREEAQKQLAVQHERLSGSYPYIIKILREMQIEHLASKLKEFYKNSEFLCLHEE